MTDHELRAAMAGLKQAILDWVAEDAHRRYPKYQGTLADLLVKPDAVDHAARNAVEGHDH